MGENRPRRDAPRAPKRSEPGTRRGGKAQSWGLRVRPAGLSRHVLVPTEVGKSGGLGPVRQEPPGPTEHGGRGCPRPTEIPYKTFRRGTAHPCARARQNPAPRPGTDTRGGARSRREPGESPTRSLTPKSPSGAAGPARYSPSNPGGCGRGRAPPQALGPRDPPEAVPSLIAASTSGKTRSRPELSLPLRPAGGFEPRTNFSNIFYRAEQKL